METIQRLICKNFAKMALLKLGNPLILNSYQQSGGPENVDNVGLGSVRTLQRVVLGLFDPKS